MEFGGASQSADARTNSNMPFGVRSKYQTMDSEEPDQDTGWKHKMSPDKSFGFRSPKAKKAALESQPTIIDKGRKAVPTRNDDLNITY